MTTHHGEAFPSPQPASLATLMRALRERARLTQEELAERSGVSVGTVRGLESGRVRRPRTGTMRLLANAIGLNDHECSALVTVARGDPLEDGGILDGARTPTRVRASPAQLPRALADFTGRAGHLKTLCDLLGGDAAPAVVVAAVGGGGGIGKTALAVQVAHLLRQRYSDGQLYAHLRGAAGVDISVADVLAGFLRALDVPAAAIPDSLDERSALYRSCLASQRMLVVLDDARSAAQVRPLLPGSETTAVLITSRSRLADLESAQLIDLDVLTVEEALALLGHVVGQDLVAAEPAAAAQLVHLCGGLPLAVRIAGARLAARPMWSIQALAERLATQHRRLDELATGDLAVRASFELSYRALSADQARAFRLMGALDWDTMPLAAVAALLDVPAAAADRLVELLADGYLLQAVSPDRFEFHDLLRLVARERCVTEESEADRARALTRVLRCYLATLRNAYHHLRRAWQVNHDHTGGYHGQAFADRDEAVHWLETERTNLGALITQACRQPQVPVALSGRILECMRVYQSLGYLADCEHAAHAVLAAALRDHDRSAEATARLMLGCLAGTGRIDFEQAIDELQTSLALSEAIGDLPIWIKSCNMLGCVYLDRGRYDDAARLFGLALERCRRGEDAGGECAALCNLGTTYNHKNEPAHALACLLPAMELAHQTGDPQLEAAVLDDLGITYRQLNRYDDAARCFSRSLDLYRRIEDPWGETLSLLSHAEANLDQGQAEAALGHCQEALKLSQDIGVKYTEARSLLVLGRTYRALGDIEQARTCWRESLAEFEAIRAVEAADVRALLEA
jgi:tetratricopeptide (TPR) repeat protein/DNA-binding XRE family transcriptional regulator